MLRTFHARRATTASRSSLLLHVTLFGFASGLPLALTGSTLQAWFTTEGLDLQTIGALSLVGLPYLYKFLWAPLLDRFGVPTLGRRRGWLLLTQWLLVGVLLKLSATPLSSAQELVVALIVVLALVSATQDIAVDAYRAEVLAPEDRGLGSGLGVMGYRLAMIASGAGALLVADHWGFGLVFLLLAGIMALLSVATLLAPEPPPGGGEAQPLWADFRDALKSLLTRPGITGLLALVAIYKLGDAFAGALSLTFLLRDQGFSLTEIGATYKLLGLAATIAGGVLGGWWVPRLGLYRALLWFGVLQAVTNLGFLLLALAPGSYSGMVVVVALENLSGGMGTSALVTLMVGVCVRDFTATHFALLSALASLARVLTGPWAGEVAVGGWVGFFGWSMVLALPGLGLLWWRRQDFLVFEQEQARIPPPSRS